MFSLSLNDNVSNIPEDVEKVCFKDVDESNVNKLYNLPKHIEEIELIGKLNHFDTPYGLNVVDCNNMGLQTIHISDDLKWLFCSCNEITEIELPDDIEMAVLSDNKLVKIKARSQLTSLKCLDISNNMITDFDIKLPQTMEIFYMRGNPENMRIKYLNFVINDYDNLNCAGDFIDILGDGILLQEYARTILGQRCFLGRKYIDLKRMI